MSPQLQNTFNSYYHLHQSVNNLQHLKRGHWLCKLDCIDDVTCDVIISYPCHASFISDKNISHSDSALSATNSELYSNEISRTCCNKGPYSTGLAKMAKSIQHF